MDLDELRQRLNAIDRQLVELIAERQSVAEKVGEHKLSSGRATRDYAREKQVLDGARDSATELGVAPEVAEEVMRLLIQTSLTKQERDRVQAEGRGQGRRALVIGGAGKMGRWFADFLHSQGYAITIADPGGEVQGYDCVGDWREAGNEFAITVVAAPLQTTADILVEMAGSGHQGLIFDIGSLKTPLIPALRQLAAAGAEVTSLHPMFGPDAELLSGRHVLFMDAGCASATSHSMPMPMHNSQAHNAAEWRARRCITPRSLLRSARPSSASRRPKLTSTDALCHLLFVGVQPSLPTSWSRE